MRKKMVVALIIPSAILLAALATGCGSGHKQGQEAPIAAVGAACFACHGNAASPPIMEIDYPAANPDGSFTTFSTSVNLYVDPAAYAASTHGAVQCLQCHVGMNPVPPHNAPRTYGSWGAIWPLNDRTTDTNLSSAPGTTDADVQHTLNYFVVPAAACLGCHGGDQALMAYINSKHATDMDRADLPSASGPWSGGPRVATFPFGSAGPQINETYNAVDCLLCHVGNNCGTCHFKSPVGQQIAGDAWTTWSSYNAPDNVYAIKLGQINRWLDWTQNIASHNFNTAADLRSSNDVCSVCHSGFSDGPDSGDLTYSDPVTNATLFSITGTSYDGHAENDELALTVSRGIHATKSHCADCHMDIHSSIIPQTLSMGWDVTQSPTECVNCHADKAFSPGSLHADVDCTGCHDAELPTVRDLSTGIVMPYRVDVNITKTYPSHNIVRGSDIDCAGKCHNANTLITAPVPLVGPTQGDNTVIHK